MQSCVLARLHRLEVLLMLLRSRVVLVSSHLFLRQLSCIARDRAMSARNGHLAIARLVSHGHITFRRRLRVGVVCCVRHGIALHNRRQKSG